MSWTAFKRELRVGRKLYVVNSRRPWRSRYVEIIARSKRSIVVKDSDGAMSNIKLPAAAFTRMTDEGAWLLAEEDGPRWNMAKEKDERGILAGEPYMMLRLDP